MADIVVFISPKFTNSDKEKIAESMRIHKIKTTNDLHCATVILEPTLQKTTPHCVSMVMESAPQNLTLTEIAEKIISETQTQLFQLKENIFSATSPSVIDMPITLPQKSHHKKTHTYDTSKTRFNYINTIRNKTVFNRTKHK